MIKRGAGKTIDHYVDLLKRSWELSWSHKELWIFGLFAAVINTGSIFSTVVKSVRRVQSADDLSVQLVSDAVNGAPWLLQYVRNLIQFDASRIILTIAAGLFTIALLVIVAIGAQQLLVLGLHRAQRKKKRLVFKRLFTQLNHLHLARLFAVNALAMLAINMTLIAVSLPISFLLSDAGLFNTLVYTGTYLLLIPIAFWIDAMAMFTLINVIRRDSNLHDAFSHSYALLKHNWLAAFEVAVLLYIFNLAAPVLFLFIAGLIATVASVIGYASLSTGTAIILAAITLLTLVVVLFFLFAISGFIVTFNYSVWLHLLVLLEKKEILPTVEYFTSSFLKRLKP